MRLRLGAMACLLAVLGSCAMAAAAPYSTAFQQTNFRYEGLLAVAAPDLDRDGRAELMVAGRNYLDGEVSFELLGWTGGAPGPFWRSPNLLESESSLLVLPVFWPEGPALAALTRTGYHIFLYRDGAYTKALAGKMDFAAEEGASGDLDGDGWDELLLSVTLRNTKSGRDKAVRVLSWRDGGFVKIAESPGLGNIRALAAGDLDRDGRDEIVVETGVTTKPGEFRMFRLDQGLTAFFQGPTSLPSAAYGLAVGRQYPEPGLCLFAASQPGRMLSYIWDGKSLIPGGINLSLQESPASLATGDLDGDGREEVILASYPHRLRILIPTAPAIQLALEGQPRRTAEPIRHWDGGLFVEARSLAELFGWEYDGAAGLFKLPGEQPAEAGRELRFDPLTLAATLDGQPLSLQPPARVYRGYLYLPLAPLARLAGYDCTWQENAGRVSLAKTAAP